MYSRTDEPDESLNMGNWDDTTHKKYHIDFLNARNAVRAVLYELIQIDNEIKCTNMEIQNLKIKFDSDLAFMEGEVQRFQDNEYLEPEDRNKEIAEMVKKIEEANQSFSKEIERFQIIKEEKCASVSASVDKLFHEKSRLRDAHRRQVESVRRFRMFCGDALRPKVDTRLKSIDRKFCDEFFYIDSCEKNLKSIFSLLEDKSSQSGICGGTSATTSVSDICPEFFSDFAWMRYEQYAKRTELFNYFKKYLAKDVVMAIAAMHVHNPEEPIKFIANFLKHLNQKAFRVKRQEKIFAAAKCGPLFPECLVDCWKPL